MPYAMRSAGWLCLGACFVLGLAAVAVGLYTAPEWMPWALSIRDNLEVWLAQTPPLWFILAMAVLPLVPVPISLFYLAAGAYGAASGIAIVLIGLAVNMSLAYGLSASLLRPLISRWIQKTGRQLPAASGRRQQLTLLLLVRLFPGFPYFLQNYLLGVARVPFGRYLAGSVLIQGAIGSAMVVLGDSFLRGRAQTAWIGFAALVVLAILARWARSRMMRRREAGAMLASIAPEAVDSR